MKTIFAYFIVWLFSTTGIALFIDANVQDETVKFINIFAGICALEALIAILVAIIQIYFLAWSLIV